MKHVEVYTCSQPTQVTLELVPTRWWLVDHALHMFCRLTRCRFCMWWPVWLLANHSLNRPSRKRFEIPAADVELLSRVRDFMEWEPSSFIEDDEPADRVG